MKKETKKNETEKNAPDFTAAQTETAYFEEDQSFENVGKIPFKRLEEGKTFEGVYCGIGKEFDTKFGRMTTHLFHSGDEGFFMVKATASLTNVLAQETHLGAHVYRVTPTGTTKTKAGFDCKTFSVQRAKNPIGRPFTPDEIEAALS